MQGSAAVVAQARRVEAAEADAVAACARTFAARGRLARVHGVGGGWAAFAGAGYPVNRAVGMGMKAPVGADELDGVERFYEELGAVAQVDVCPYADPSLAGLVSARGYTLLRFVAVLVRAVRPEDSTGGEAAAGPMTIEPLRADDAELWAQTAARAITDRQTVGADDVNLLLARAALARPDVRCFLARWQGQPVGVGALAVHHGLATLLSATVLRSFRGRGVHAALVSARIAEAARAGCDLAAALLVPGSDAERNLERAGFRALYTRTILRRARAG